MNDSTFSPIEDPAAESQPREKDPRWQLVQRILSSPDFQRSPQLTKFLLYVASAALDNRTQELSEHHLGVGIFGRQPGYDSAADTIVRAHALRLRRRLEHYFQKQGSNEPMHLMIPRGSYAPIFSVAKTKAAQTASEGAFEEYPSDPVQSESSAVVVDRKSDETSDDLHRAVTESRSKVWRYRLFTSMLLLCVLFLTALFALHLRSHSSYTRHHLLWGRLFTESQPTRIVLADSGLVLFHAATHQYVSLHEYLNNDYSSHLQHVQHVDPEFAQFLLHRRYTSFVDAVAISRFMRLPEASPQRTLVEYSRDMHIEDFNTDNLILIGAQEAVPWVELFEKHMDFVFSTDNPNGNASFRNHHVNPGERDNYPLAASKAFGVIAFLPNLSASGNALIIEGYNGMGTEAALDLVTDDEKIFPALKSILKPDGTLPHFEMLVESDIEGDGAGPARIVAIHVHD